MILFCPWSCILKCLFWKMYLYLSGHQLLILMEAWSKKLSHTTVNKTVSNSLWIDASLNGHIFSHLRSNYSQILKWKHIYSLSWIRHAIYRKTFNTRTKSKQHEANAGAAILNPERKYCSSTTRAFHLLLHEKQLWLKGQNNLCRNLEVL